jgi:hypothetical protein
MEFNIEEIGGQLVECSNGKFVIRVRAKVKVNVKVKVKVTQEHPSADWKLQGSRWQLFIGSILMLTWIRRFT